MQSISGSGYQGNFAGRVLPKTPSLDLQNHGLKTEALEKGADHFVRSTPVPKSPQFGASRPRTPSPTQTPPPKGSDSSLYTKYLKSQVEKHRSTNDTELLKDAEKALRERESAKAEQEKERAKTNEWRKSNPLYEN